MNMTSTAAMTTHSVFAAISRSPVPDRLDDGDANMTRLVLDRVDHCLDAFADHDGLDLDHSRFSRKIVSRQMPSRFAMRSRTPTTRKPHRSCSASDVWFSGKIE